MFPMAMMPCNPASGDSPATAAAPGQTVMQPMMVMMPMMAAPGANGQQQFMTMFQQPMQQQQMAGNVRVS